MKEMDYREEVLKVYPDAEELDNETEDYYPNLSWITDGHGNDISEDCNWEKSPWKSAYERLKFLNLTKTDQNGK